jgi:hypothetical protein
MSVYRLNTFIKENHHDVIDYWAEKSVVRYVRVISRKSGHIYMVKVAGYNISLGEDRDPLTKTECFYLEPLDDDDSVPEDMGRLYDTFLSAFPEHRYRFVLQQSGFFMESRDQVFRACNMPSDSLYNVHLFVELEWFYDNLYIVNHEIDRNISSILVKAKKVYEGFVPMYTKFVRDPEKDVAMVQSTWRYFMEQTDHFEKSRKFYVSLCAKENDISTQLAELGNIRAEALSFQDTVRRSYSRKSLHDKMTKLRRIHIVILEKMTYHQSIQNNLLLHFFFFLADITLLLTKFHTHFIKLDRLVPSRDKKPL